MNDFDEMLEELRQKRDELRVQMNLASKELREEWDELEDKMDEFSHKAKAFAGEAGLKDTGEGVGKALGQLGHEIKLGYERLRKAARED
jgi:hypothetical protein